MDILRFITAGNVDDGKSTLIGRLLYDTDNIKSDILETVTDSDAINLAFITDGLRSEREQGITIDVAYKYFTTETRKYIITDAPGHFQYTRNLVSGASNVDVMIILIDAQNGITEQTKRHSLVAAFLQIKQIVVTINKMDAIDYDKHKYDEIKNQFMSIANELKLNNITFIPISALQGDNVSFSSNNMNWYDGKTLLEYLTDCTPLNKEKNIARFIIQYKIKSKEAPEVCYAGRLLSGKLNVGQSVIAYPSKNIHTISRIINGYAESHEAAGIQNLILYFGNTSDLQRGDCISPIDQLPQSSNRLELNICWLDETFPLLTGKKYFLLINTKETIGTVTSIIHKIDNNTFEKRYENSVSVNQFARIVVELDAPIVHDEYSTLPETARGIMIDPETNYSSGAFTIHCPE